MENNNKYKIIELELKIKELKQELEYIKKDFYKNKELSEDELQSVKDRCSEIEKNLYELSTNSAFLTREIKTVRKNTESQLKQNSQILNRVTISIVTTLCITVLVSIGAKVDIVSGFMNLF